jgi:hypothetical protein
MSYESENELPAATRIADVRDFVFLLGYRREGNLKDEEFGRFENYGWFEDADYRFWSGVELSIYKTKDRVLTVSTRTPVGRSYHDLKQQNRTIAAIRKRFGGSFKTDEGSGRYSGPSSCPCCGGRFAQARRDPPTSVAFTGRVRRRCA